MSESDLTKKRKTRPSFIWPIVLILIGGMFLLTNLGIIEGEIWDRIWRLWPVLFIAIGLDNLFRRNEIAGPVFFICVGSMILMSSYNVIGWGTWDILGRFWPLLLVAIGLEILFGRRSLWLSALVVLIMVAGIGGAVWTLGEQPVLGETLQDHTISQPLVDVDKANITVSQTVGAMTIDGLLGSPLLISGEVVSDGQNDVIVNYDSRGNVGSYTIESRPIVSFPGVKPADLNLNLTIQIPLDLDLSMAVGKMDLDLSSLDTNYADVNQAVGEVIVRLAGGADYHAEISQAVGSIVVYIPENTGVRIDISKAISNLTLPNNFERREDSYYSPGYDTAQYQLTLAISQAVGSILIK